MSSEKEELELVIGNKNLSSWSMRPWFLLRQANIPFREHVFLFEEPNWRERIVEFSPSLKVPVLRHGDVVVNESLGRSIQLIERLGSTESCDETLTRDRDSVNAVRSPS